MSTLSDFAAELRGEEAVRFAAYAARLAVVPIYGASATDPSGYEVRDYILEEILERALQHLAIERHEQRRRCFYNERVRAEQLQRQALGLESMRARSARQEAASAARRAIKTNTPTPTKENSHA